MSFSKDSISLDSGKILTMRGRSTCFRHRLNIGVYFGDCPSAGHDMICLDYRNCGRSGVPQVVHVDQEFDYRITFLADTFEDFIKGLRSNDEFEV